MLKFKETGEMISGFVPSQFYKKHDSLQIFSLFMPPQLELGAAVLTFVTFVDTVTTRPDISYSVVKNLATAVGFTHARRQSSTSVCFVSTIFSK